MKTPEGVISVVLNAQQAYDTRDGLSKAIYKRFFDWIVLSINKSTARKDEGKEGLISLLDIFG